jgi:hypothetical protein
MIGLGALRLCKLLQALRLLAHVALQFHDLLASALTTVDCSTSIWSLRGILLFSISQLLLREILLAFPLKATSALQPRSASGCKARNRVL